MLDYSGHPAIQLPARSTSGEALAAMMSAIDALERAAQALTSAVTNEYGPYGLSAVAALGAGHRLESLTDRERDVARLVGSGLSNQQIAHRLCMSVRTVESHLRHIYRKVDVGSRVGLSRLVAGS